MDQISKQRPQRNCCPGSVVSTLLCQTPLSRLLNTCVIQHVLSAVAVVFFSLSNQTLFAALSNPVERKTQREFINLSLRLQYCMVFLGGCFQMQVNLFLFAVVNSLFVSGAGLVLCGCLFFSLPFMTMQIHQASGTHYHLCHINTGSACKCTWLHVCLCTVFEHTLYLLGNTMCPIRSNCTWQLEHACVSQVMSVMMKDQGFCITFHQE